MSPTRTGNSASSDIHERKYWKQYVKAYEACLQATSTHHTPWYVVPADDKENARLIVSRIVLDALKTSRWPIQKPQRSAERNCSRFANCYKRKKVYLPTPGSRDSAKREGQELSGALCLMNQQIQEKYRVMNTQTLLRRHPPNRSTPQSPGWKRKQKSPHAATSSPG